MKSFDYTLTDPLGLHARPCGLLVREVKKYPEKITVSHGDKSVEANRLMALMAMGCKGGDTVTVTVEGENEDSTFEIINKFFKDNF